MTAYEVNFDGLVGPTHNFGGLSFGNVASGAHGQQTSNPREAARQGLRKMKRLHDLGFRQAVLPPHERPDMGLLRQLGFHGNEAQILAQVAREAPHLLTAASSASPMWTANAATVSPSHDTQDGRVHFTPANLNAKLHRAREHQTTARVLRGIFADESRFAHHPALPGVSDFGDEGAANHTRLCATYDQPGVGFFVYGRDAADSRAPLPARFPARQTRQTCEAIARQHGLVPERVVLAQQNPDAVDAGVFHNDVIAVGNQNVLFYHEQAFLETSRTLQSLSEAMQGLGSELLPVCVPEAAVSLQDAVQSYLFNSQLLSRPEGGMLLLVPSECRSNPRVSAYLDELVSGPSPISDVLSMDLRESMKNGGGPACLRLRVVLTAAECEALSARVFLDDDLYRTLEDWIDRHYRDRLNPADLADPQLLRACREALDELSGILGLGAVYPFQQQVESAS